GLGFGISSILLSELVPDSRLPQATTMLSLVRAGAQPRARAAATCSLVSRPAYRIPLVVATHSLVGVRGKPTPAEFQTRSSDLTRAFPTRPDKRTRSLVEQRDFQIPLPAATP